MQQPRVCAATRRVALGRVVLWVRSQYNVEVLGKMQAGVYEVCKGVVCGSTGGVMGCGEGRGEPVRAQVHGRIFSLRNSSYR